MTKEKRKWIPRGKALVLDDKATPRTPGKPAFLSRPEGAPVYYGFPLIEETRADGWVYGAITGFESDRPEGCTYGDGFVEAPDGTRAGLIWEVGEQEVQQSSPPEPGRWGVYYVWFPRPIKSIDDLVIDFRHVLPALKRIHAQVHGSHESSTGLAER